MRRSRDARIVMHLAHWGLARSPFAGGGAPLFFAGEGQVESLARLRYGVRGGLKSLIEGVRGVGKSQLLAQFSAECRRSGRPVAAVDLTGISPREFLWDVASQLSLGPRIADDVARLHRRLADFAAGATRSESAAALLLDNAHQAGADVLMQLVRLVGAGSSGAPWLAAALTTTLDGAPRLGRELLERLDLHVELEPWSEADTVGYVQHALVECGSVRPVFEDEALAVLHLLSEGIPRRVNRLAEHALLGGAAEGRGTIDAGLVEAAHDAVAWATPA